MHDGLQDLGGVFADAAGLEQVVEHEQVRLHPIFQPVSPFAGVAQCITGELGVGLQVMGDIRAGVQPSILVISEPAGVNGQIHADHVIINGSVKRPVVVTTLPELRPKARIEGDVAYRALDMHQGAMISGQLKPAAEAAEEKPPLKLAANNA